MKERIERIIDKLFGEQNLYKMPLDSAKYCKHGNNIYCDKCKKELEKEDG